MVRIGLLRRYSWLVLFSQELERGRGNDADARRTIAQRISKEGQMRQTCHAGLLQSGNAGGYKARTTVAASNDIDMIHLLQCATG
jgi:hypothetical protein